MVTTIIEPMAIMRNATAIRNIMLSSAFMYMHMAKLNINVSGDLTATLITIMKAICTSVISVVIRVTSPGTLNLSMLENENVCILEYIASLKFAAKPAEALAEYLPAKAPNVRLKKAMSTIRAPRPYTTGIFPASSPSSIILAVTNGSNISIITSSVVSPTHIMASFL